MTWLAVALGGAAGAACRYLVDFVVAQRTSGAFPWGTWTVNITGSLLLGVLVGFAAGTDEPRLWQVAATAGFCGAYTTFSTYMDAAAARGACVGRRAVERGQSAGRAGRGGSRCAARPADRLTGGRRRAGDR